MIATTQNYRRVTGDLASYDGDVMIALADAQDEFLRRTGRVIELGTHTETLPVYDDGRVYPAGTPLTGVLDPPNAVFDGFSIAIAGGGYAYGGYQPYPADVLVGTDRRPPPGRRTVTYTGGYAPAPSDVLRCVCEMAAYSLHPAFGLDLPAGTKSVTLGDQSITGRFDASSSWPASVTRVIAKWTRADP